MRFHIIGNASIKNVGKYQSCMVSKLPIIWKRTRTTAAGGGGSREDGAAMLIDTQADIDVLRSDLELPPSPARVRRMHAASAEFSQGSMGAGGCVYN